jgi:hypothetical protein
VTYRGAGKTRLASAVGRLLNHSIRAQQQRLRDAEPERFRALEADNQLKAPF